MQKTGAHAQNKLWGSGATYVLVLCRVWQRDLRDLEGKKDLAEVYPLYPFCLFWFSDLTKEDPIWFSHFCVSSQ